MPAHRPATAPGKPTSEQLEHFYRQRSDQLRRSVAAHVRTDDQTILEDACQTAWLTLLRRPDITLDDRGASWLITVAIRVGWRLAQVSSAIPSGPFRGDDPEPQELMEPAALDGDPAARAVERADHESRTNELQKLRPIEQRDLLLQAAGYRYDEIIAMTATSASAVNRNLAVGRARLRRFEAVRRHREEREGRI